MPKTKTKLKTDLLCTRLTPEIKSIIGHIAAQEGVNSSEWVRKLIIKELRALDVLQTQFYIPTIEKEE